MSSSLPTSHPSNQPLRSQVKIFKMIAVMTCALPLVLLPGFIVPAAISSAGSVAMAWWSGDRNGKVMRAVMIIGSASTIGLLILLFTLR